MVEAEVRKKGGGVKALSAGWRWAPPRSHPEPEQCRSCPGICPNAPPPCR